MARWPGEYNNENDPVQQSYGREFWRASREIGSRIAEGSINTLAQTWEEAQSWRSARASLPESNLFSASRQDRGASVHFTPLAGEYSYIKDRYSQRSDGVLEPSPLPDIADSRRFTLTDQIDGRPITLTSIVVSTDPNTDRTAEQYSSLRDIGMDALAEPHYIEHTGVEEAQRVMTHAESLFGRATDSSLSKPDTVRTLGELHWWMANAMPDERGSAAKAELTVRSIAQSRGIDLPPFVSGVVPDLEAMTTSREKFSDNYASMFSRSP